MPACADSAPGAHDPFERANRGLFSLGQGLDRAIVRPVALVYTAVLPKPVRTGVRNVLDNLDEPNTALNDALQARPKRVATAVGRFAINSTVGVLGLFDVATKLDLPKHDADFGQTLGRWGFGAGPYVYVPVLGPSDLRDGFGRVVDAFTGLLSIHDLHVTPDERLGVAVVDGIDTRASLDSTLEDLNKSATDPYVAQRSAYQQHRASVVTETSKAIEQLPSFDEPAAPNPKP